MNMGIGHRNKMQELDMAMDIDMNIVIDLGWDIDMNTNKDIGTSKIFIWENRLPDIRVRDLYYDKNFLQYQIKTHVGYYQHNFCVGVHL
jgi:hypothetical protein